MKKVKPMYRRETILARNISIAVLTRRSFPEFPSGYPFDDDVGAVPVAQRFPASDYAHHGVSAAKRGSPIGIKLATEVVALQFGSSLNPAAISPGSFQLLPMRGGKKIRIAFYLLAAGGAALFTLLLIRQGAPHVIAAFASAGWWIAVVAIYHLAVPLFLDAIAWWALFPKSERLSLWQLFWMRWIGESVSTLVPSATVGGDVVRARLAALHGAPIPTAAASVLVDITLGVFVQIVFTLLGLGLIVAVTGRQGFVRPTLIGAVIGVLAIIGFYFVQRLGMFRFIGKMIRGWRIRRIGIRWCTAATPWTRRFAGSMRGGPV